MKSLIAPILFIAALTTSCSGATVASTEAEPSTCVSFLVASGDSPVGVLDILDKPEAVITDSEDSMVFVRDASGDALYRGLKVGETVMVCDA